MNVKLIVTANLKYLLVIVFVLTHVNVNSQQPAINPNKVEIFTHQEKDNLQLWFHNEIKAMEFTEEELAQYYAVIFYYISKISRLDDKDKGYTNDEFKKELNKYLSLQEKELKELLSAERFEIHEKLYGVFLNSAYKRWGISN
jgi:hypothetical protein